jgi:Putative DNA-binding domain
MSHDPAAGFTQALRNPDAPPPAHIQSPGGAPAGRRFDVYRNNVAHGLIEALGSIFPAVKAQCGPERFADAARLYLAQHPPRSRMVFEHGRDFADFLNGFAPARRTMPWLADLARLERAWLDAYHAADAAPLDAEELAAIPPADLAATRFAPHPAARLVRSRFAIHDLFEAGRAGHVLKNPDAAQDCLITRPHLSVEVRLLPAGGAAFLGAVLSGLPLGEALGAGLGEAADFDIPAALGALLQSGAVSATL